MTLVNVSDISKFGFCPRQYILQRVHHHRVASSKYFFGSYEHEVDRLVNTRCPHLLKKNQLIPETQILQKIDQLLRKSLDYATRIAQNATPEMQIELDHYKKLLYQRLRQREHEHVTTIWSLKSQYALETLIDRFYPIECEKAVASERLGFKGRIDQIYRLGDALIPWDLKTIDEVLIPCFAESYALQVCAYGMLLEEQYQLPVTMGWIYYSAVPRLDSIWLSHQLRARVLECRDKIQVIHTNPTAVRIDEYPVTDLQRCKICFLQDHCPPEVSDEGWVDRLFSSNQSANRELRLECENVD